MGFCVLRTTKETIRKCAQELHLEVSDQDAQSGVLQRRGRHTRLVSSLCFKKMVGTSVEGSGIGVLQSSSFWGLDCGFGFRVL